MKPLTKNQQKVYDALKTGKGLEGKTDLEKQFNMVSFCIMDVAATVFGEPAIGWKPSSVTIEKIGDLPMCLYYPGGLKMFPNDDRIWPDHVAAMRLKGHKGAAVAAEAFKRACIIYNSK